MLDRGAITAGLIQIVRDIVGSQLSTYEVDGNDIPAVVSARLEGWKLDLPFMTVDVNNFILPSGWLLHSYFDDTDTMTYEILYEMFVDFKCFGNGSQDILRRLHSSFSMSPIRGRITDEVFGASVQIQGEVISTPDLLSTNYEEGATLTSSFYIIETLQDPTGEVLETIEDVVGQGTLITGVDGDIIIDIDTQPLHT